MNSKAQFEMHPFAMILGVIGGILGVYMADKMMAGTFMKIMVFAVVSVVCTLVSSFIFNKE